jgi:hypothetical protein
MDSSDKRLNDEINRLLNQLETLIYNNYLAVLNFIKKLLPGNTPFWFSKNAAANRQMDKLIASFNKNANALFLSGIERSWKLGEESLIDKMKLAFSGDASQRKAFDQIRTEATQQQRDQSSKASAERFAAMKRNGLTLSDCVWRLGNGMKQEIETIVQNGMKEGKTPDQLAKELKKYLAEPDKLFRRVRDKVTGNMELSEAAKKYKPGRGVYRSASKNAARVARTEIPAAYRRAQWEKFQDDPRITGIRIQLSNNHTCINPKTGKPEPFYDICDELVGDYPKSFLWTGWHPQCRCVMTPIVVSGDEATKLIDAQVAGKTYTPKQITEMPKAFSDWLRINNDRIVRAQANNNLPYWLNDNLVLLQKSGIIGKEGFTTLAAKGLFTDPMQVNSFLSLIDFMRAKAAPQLRKIAFDLAMKNERYQRENDVFYMKDSVYSRTEKQTAEKLTKAGYYVVFPSGKQIKDIKIRENDSSARKNDVYIYDKNTYKQRKVDLKTVNGASPEAISSHIASGSGQAPVIAIDIIGKISKQDLIGAIRSGWGKNTKEVLLNYKGQWYEINKEKAFDKKWLTDNLK